MVSDDWQRIQEELQWVIGPAGVDAALVEHDDLGFAVRLETAQHVYEVGSDYLLEVLTQLPDLAGPLALREAIEGSHTGSP